MKVLFDTHVWLWWRSDPEKLNRRVRRLCESRSTELFFSAASAWEIAIKVRLGRLRLQEPVQQFLVSRLHEDRVEELPITLLHAAGIAALPDLHRDPFDRLLIAQSRHEHMTLLTADENVLQYGGPVMNAR